MCNALLQFSPVVDVCINVLVRAAGLVVVSSSSSPTHTIESANTASSKNSKSNVTVAQE